MNGYTLLLTSRHTHSFRHPELILRTILGLGDYFNAEDVDLWRAQERDQSRPVGRSVYWSREILTALLNCVWIGGWGGCEYYSAAMKTSSNRTTFINALSSAVNEYDLDGKLSRLYCRRKTSFTCVLQELT